jgi:hypothetical protein
MAPTVKIPRCCTLDLDQSWSSEYLRSSSRLRREVVKEDIIFGLRLSAEVHELRSSERAKAYGTGKGPMKAMIERGTRIYTFE